MTQIDSIIFDLDGTLVDSREDIVNAVNYTLISLGLEKKTFEKIVSYIGTGINDLLNTIFANLSAYQKASGVKIKVKIIEASIPPITTAPIADLIGIIEPS